MIRGSGPTIRGGPVPPVEPPPPSSPFGTSLPARMPESSGSQYYVATTGSDSNSGSISSPWLTIQNALTQVPVNGSIINVRGGTYSPGSEIVWSRVGNSSNPVTVRSYPGESAIVNGTRFLVYNASGTASGLRIRDLTIRNGTDGVKVEYGHHVEIDDCLIHNVSNMGLLIGGDGSPATDVQMWNTIIHTVGDFSPSDNQDHSVYVNEGGDVVLANCLFYNLLCGFAVQIYPGPLNDVIVTCCTMDDFGTRGPFILDSVSQARVIACIGTNAATGFMDPWSGSGVNIQDNIAFGNGATNFPAQAGFTYTNNSQSNPLYVNAASRNYRIQSGSPAINIASARPQWIPATDLEGAARVTADAGCYKA